MKKKWANLLSVPVVERVERVPNGWQTCDQIADELNLSRVQTSIYLRKAVKADSVAVKRFRIMTGRGMYPVPHYRAKP